VSRLAGALALLLLVAGQARAQWTPDTTVVLRGKVVSMTDAPIAQGQVVVKGGRIVAVLKPGAPVPQGALVLETKGFIYPGLVNLHDHLLYDALPLYDLPRHFDNHHDWPSGASYEEHVSQPYRVLSDAKLLDRGAEALKLAEVRSLVGGETSVQGSKEVAAIDGWLVRNVELSNFGEDRIDDRTFAIDQPFWDQLSWQRPKLKKLEAWILHLGEGIDAAARGEWSNPAFDPTRPVTPKNRPGVVEADLVWEGLVGVHCTALTEADFARWKQLAGRPRVVWSPTSNLMLYGKTTDVRAALRQGALIALGTDWSPTGTRNLLWELKVAERLNRETLGGLFTDRQLVELVTTNPAALAGWEAQVGRLQAGFAADLLVVDDLGAGDGYRNLLRATEQHVQLVLVGGDPLYGDERHLARLKTYAGAPRYEVVPETQGARPKAIDLRSTPEVPLGTQTLAELRARVLRAMQWDPADVAAEAAGDAEATTWLKAETIKALERAGDDVPEALRDPAAPFSAAQAADLLRLRFGRLKPVERLEPLFTDGAFLDLLARNLHAGSGAGVVLDLRETEGLLDALDFGQ